ncbi:hypothetical protein OPV22_014896 [Ensete ventricosum]|uniref:Uncharacterized protein n=1 Tax=Ensete ventricosum TaxID=4639 RepID=A0AAV8R8M6_ENSVE|nr:hypothetical protein OPV22_014896 [Ensete ventricosum]
MPMTRRERGLPKQTNRAAVSVSEKRGTVRMKAARHLLCFLGLWEERKPRVSWLSWLIWRNTASELLLLPEEGDDGDVLLEELLLQELDAEQGLLVLELLHQRRSSSATLGKRGCTWAEARGK